MLPNSVLCLLPTQVKSQTTFALVVACVCASSPVLQLNRHNHSREKQTHAFQSKA